MNDDQIDALEETAEEAMDSLDGFAADLSVEDAAAFYAEMESRCRAMKDSFR